MTPSAWSSLLILTVLWASGYSLSRLLLPGNRLARGDALLRFGIAPLLGCLLFAWLLYLPLAMGARWTWGYLGAVWCIHGGLALWAVQGVFRGWRRSLAAWEKASYSVRFSFLATVVILLSTAVPAATGGLWGYDARAIHGLKAKVLAEQGTLNEADFRDVHRLHFQPDYPLLVPIIESQVFMLAGYEQDQGLLLLFWGFVVSIGCLWASWLLSLDGTQGAWLVPVFMLTPWLGSFAEGGGVSGSVDVVLVTYLLAGGIGVARALTAGNQRYAAMGGLAFAGTMLVKQEGTLWAALAMISMVITWVWTRQRWTISRPLSISVNSEADGEPHSGEKDDASWAIPRKILLTTFGIMAAMVLPVFLLLQWTHGDIPQSPLYRSYSHALSWGWLITCGSRVPQIVQFAAAEFVNNVWGFGWGGLAFALVLKRRYRLTGEVLFLRILAGIAVACYIAIFLVTPYPLLYHLFTAFRRLMFHAYPLAILILAEQLCATRLTHQLGWVLWGGKRPRQPSGNAPSCDKARTSSETVLDKAA